MHFSIASVLLLFKNPLRACKLVCNIQEPTASMQGSVQYCTAPNCQCTVALQRPTASMQASVNDCEAHNSQCTVALQRPTASMQASVNDCEAHNGQCTVALQGPTASMQASVNDCEAHNGQCTVALQRPTASMQASVNDCEAHNGQCTVALQGPTASMQLPIASVLWLCKDPLRACKLVCNIVQLPIAVYCVALQGPTASMQASVNDCEAHNSHCSARPTGMTHCEHEASVNVSSIASVLWLCKTHASMKLDPLRDSSVNIVSSNSQCTVALQDPLRACKLSVYCGSETHCEHASVLCKTHCGINMKASVQYCTGPNSRVLCVALQGPTARMKASVNDCESHNSHQGWTRLKARSDLAPEMGQPAGSGLRSSVERSEQKMSCKLRLSRGHPDVWVKNPLTVHISYFKASGVELSMVANYLPVKIYPAMRNKNC
ncbi:hypothetical protein J6590_055992 [Homalodisca vitripennis]|nr:hypothetical protein J6590_055992 [Homalodisca vitripennis]